MEKDSRYFKHDSNARHDVKIKSLINKLGIVAYGRFWILIEILRDSSFYRLEINDMAWEGMAEDMRCSVEEAKSFIDECVKRELLQQEDGFIYSISLLHRMDKLADLRNKRSIAGKAGADARWGN